MTDACVTLEEVLAAAAGRCASLVPETAGYLTLAIADATSRLPLSIEDAGVLLTTEGTVTMARRGSPVAGPESARALRGVLARLLAVSSGMTMAGLGVAARPRQESERGADAVVEELEAALIPVNRSAARRSLARLARETARARESGRLQRALRTMRPVAPVAQVPSAVQPAVQVLVAPMPAQQAVGGGVAVGEAAVVAALSLQAAAPQGAPDAAPVAPVVFQAPPAAAPVAFQTAPAAVPAAPVAFQAPPAAAPVAPVAFQAPPAAVPAAPVTFQEAPAAAEIPPLDVQGASVIPQPSPRLVPTLVQPASWKAGPEDDVPTELPAEAAVVVPTRVGEAASSEETASPVVLKHSVEDEIPTELPSQVIPVFTDEVSAATTSAFEQRSSAPDTEPEHDVSVLDVELGAEQVGLADEAALFEALEEPPALTDAAPSVVEIATDSVEMAPFAFEAAPEDVWVEPEPSAVPASAALDAAQSAVPWIQGTPAPRPAVMTPAPESAEPGREELTPFLGSVVRPLEVMPRMRIEATPLPSSGLVGRDAPQVTPEPTPTALGMPWVEIGVRAEEEPAAPTFLDVVTAFEPPARLTPLPDVVTPSPGSLTVIPTGGVTPAPMTVTEARSVTPAPVTTGQARQATPAPAMAEPTPAPCSATLPTSPSDDPQAVSSRAQGAETDTSRGTLPTLDGEYARNEAGAREAMAHEAHEAMAHETHEAVTCVPGDVEVSEAYDREDLQRGSRFDAGTSEEMGTGPEPVLTPTAALLQVAVASADRSPVAPETPTRADELLAHFGRGDEDPMRRTAARTLKALAGLDLTATPPPLAGFTLVEPARRSAAGQDLSVEEVPHETASLAPPSPLVPTAVLASTTRPKRSLWRALLALMLVGAGLAFLVRPGLLDVLVDSATAASP
ncbi:hypothetical protein [Chondromyces crocatus]|uniref:Uncharacterized protein n=1 Tax=Chondromyces crocatus TaxID=52 RepID=A0A0K1ERC6_CHOCO|nr:hypothetical protein [Chondromyces crocatus]AKT43158.1 uncharacterized protein CMC5_073880 [Chondromyces crocatus]